jgi:hypothetical protein
VRRHLPVGSWELPLQSVGHADERRTLLEQQSGAEDQAGLVVQERLPLLGGHKLGQDDQQLVVAVAAVHLVDVAQQRGEQRAEG